MAKGGRSKQEIMMEMENNQKMMDMMDRQSRTQMDMATQNMNNQLAIAKMQTDTATATSQQAAMAGVLGAAMGANKTTETIRQWLPHEVGAATLQSWELAEKWNTTRTMREQGYQDVAINYQLQGKNYKALFSDAQWNSLQMAKLTQKDMMSNAGIFGVKSDKNPFGVNLSRDEWIKLNSFKDPSEMLKVDPRVAAQRQQQFAEWERQMRASGNGMVVDIYKNPQLGGSTILTMKGKDPLIDPRLMPLLENMMTTTQSGDPIYAPKKTQTHTQPLSTMEREMKARQLEQQAKGIHRKDDASNGRYNQMMSDAQRIRAGSLSPGASTYQTTSGGELIGFGPNKVTKPDMSKLMGLTEPEHTPHRAEIERLQKSGLIDKYGMINAGVLMSYIPPELTQAPEFNMFRELNEQEMVRLTDQYNQLGDVALDPKLIQQQNLGFGAVRTTRLNPDGTIMSQMVEMDMIDMMGNTFKGSITGGSLQAAYDRQSIISGMGPLFPGRLAPVTEEQKSGQFEPGFWGPNVLARPATGMPGQPGERKAAQQAKPQMATATDPYKTAGATQSPVAGSGTKTAGSAPSGAPATAGTLGKALVTRSEMPAGYDAAPLAAGE